MSEAKHTPGPWKATFREGRAASMYGHDVSCDMHAKPGVVAGCDGVAGVRGHNDEEARANTRLIAAAPDLYAELDMMCRAHCGSCGCDLANTPGCGECSRIRGGRRAILKANPDHKHAAAWAAIDAKAEGR